MEEQTKVCFLSSRHEGEESLLTNELRGLWGPNQEQADFPKSLSSRGAGAGGVQTPSK